MESTFAGEIVQLWVDIGLYDVILPFLFIYTIVYMILEKTSILGARKNIDALVAFCFGFIATASLQTVTALHVFFSATGFLVVAGLCVMILVGMFGLDSVMSKKDKWYLNLPRYGIISIIGLGMLYIVAMAFGLERAIIAFIPQIPDAVTQMIIAGAVFVLVMRFIMGDSSSASSAGPASKSESQPEKPKKKGDKKNETARSASQESDSRTQEAGDLVEKLFPQDESYTRRFNR
ncbi:MAG: hypothetical protein ACLFTR_03535 [Candidatus Woesearchaeota archaeon]